VSDQPRDIDLDEDLFDFGGAGQESEPVVSDENLEEIFASFRDEVAKEELLPAASAPAARPAPAPRVEAETPRPVEPARAPRAETQLHAAPPLAGALPVPAPRAARFSRGLVAIALAVTVLNSGLAVVMLRGDARRHDVRATGDEQASVPREPAPERRASADGSLPDPESVPGSHDHPTLDEARAELARGDHAAARRRVYGLLAIVDRLEEPRKSELEAECQYLVAQSLHLEALARMGAHE